MKSPTGFCAALVGSGFWFVTSIVVAAMPYHVAISNDAPPIPPVQDTGAFDAEDRSTAPVLDEYTSSCACCRWQVWANAMFLTRSSTDQRLVFDGKAEEICPRPRLWFRLGSQCWFGLLPRPMQQHRCGVLRDRRLDFYRPSCRSDITVLFPSGPTGIRSGSRNIPLHVESLQHRDQLSSPLEATLVGSRRWRASVGLRSARSSARSSQQRALAKLLD